VLASFEPRDGQGKPASWRFVRKPTVTGGRHFESQPDRQPGRYEPTLNVRREDLSGTSNRTSLWNHACVGSVEQA